MKLTANFTKITLGLLTIVGLITLLTPNSLAKVVDADPVTDQRWIISEIYLGDSNYKGAYIELYNNDQHTALGWRDFIINLPFDIDLPPIFDLHTYKPHTYKQFPLDEGWVGWLAKKYIQIMYGDNVFYEIEDALDEQGNYSYQRCQTTYQDGTRVLSNKFYYGRKTPGKPIDCADKSVTITNPDDLPEPNICQGLKLNELGTYLEPEDQFIELVNTANNTINLSNCYVAKSISTSALHQQLANHDLEPGELYSFKVEETDLQSLTKTSGIVYLIDSDDETVIDYKRYSNVKENASVAIDENGRWQMTYKLTPGEDNVIEIYPACPDGQYRDETTHRCRTNQPDPDNNDNPANKPGLAPCREGYERNPATNRCRKVVDEENDGLEPCRDGYERNPQTNRCRKITTDTSSSGLSPCRDGYERNPETNRCVKIKSADSTLVPCREGYTRNPDTNRCVKNTATTNKLVPCKDGYERNPETNRCVKSKTDGKNSGGKAKYSVTVPEADSGQADSITSLWIVIGIIATASAGILIWQYRQEIKRWWHNLTNQTRTKVRLTDDPPTDGSTSDWLDKLTK